MTRIAQTMANWQQEGHALRISINLDHSLLANHAIFDVIDQILKTHGISNNHLTFEISQSGEEAIDQNMREQMTQIRVQGFKIALDDFGFSPKVEQQLPELPIDEIKMNRHAMLKHGGEEHIEKTIINAMHLAASLGLRTVIVGVEKQSHLTWMKDLGCDVAQGYFFGQPMSADDFKTNIFESGQHFAVEEIQERHKLLILEDEIQQQNILTELLGELFEIFIAGTISEAKTIFDAESPSLLIIDVNLPDGSGIDFCAELSQNNAQESFSALFISGDDTLQNRLHAYDAGGSDFICKPFLNTELVAKLGRLSVHQTKKQRLSSNATEFQSVALQSMQEAAHYGDIVQFFKNLFHCRDEQAIAKELFQFMNQKGLKSSIQFTCDNGIVSFDQNAPVCSPVEMNIFELLRDKGRLFDFGRRTIVNDQHVSFLVKNMPEDKDEHGRARDYIAVIIEGMEARYRDILRERLIQTVFQKLETLTQQIAIAMSDDKSSQSEALDHFSVELKMSFHALDLTLEQEEHISGIVESMLQTKEENENHAAKISSQIGKIIKELSSTIQDLEHTAHEVVVEDSQSTAELF